MMIARNARGLTAAAILMLSAGTAPAAPAQVPVEGGSSGGVAGQGASASTYGAGDTGGQALGVQGGGAAKAAEGGGGSPRSKATWNEGRAVQSSMAMARGEDERALSRTRTVVRQGDTVRSTTTSVYKQKGEPPVRE